MTTQTRPACKSDYDWLYALHREAYLDVIMRQFGSWDKDEQLRFFRTVWKSHAITVLIVDDEPTGMFQLDEYDDHLWLAELQIATRYQNKRIGSRTIQMLLMKARVLGSSLRLRVLHENQCAHRLYQRLGFRRISGTQHHHVMEAT